jgi:hypothetical protein
MSRLTLLCDLLDRRNQVKHQVLKSEREFLEGSLMLNQFTAELIELYSLKQSNTNLADPRHKPLMQRCLFIENQYEAITRKGDLMLKRAHMIRKDMRQNSIDILNVVMAHCLF